MAAPSILVAGLDPLGLAVIERLAEAGAVPSALISPADAARSAHELGRLGVSFTVGSARIGGELLAAGLQSADVLVLTADDDAENIDAALAARRLRPELPLVIRLFDPALGAYLRATLEGVVILSTSAVAAPVFADLALRALAEPSPARPIRDEAGLPRRRGGWRLRLDRMLVGLFLGLLALVVPSTVYFAFALHLRLIDALYFVWTTVMTVGYGDISLRAASDVDKLLGMLLMFGGATFLAVLYALLADVLVARRFERLQGRVPVRRRGHVVIAGAGNVGLRVAGILAEHDERVVLIERNGSSRNVNALRAAGHHVIVADASVAETLDLAGLVDAKIVLALTDSDATNLQVALAVRQRTDAAVVVRLASAELSRHVLDRQDALAASSVAIASEAFARAALDACEPLRVRRSGRP